MKMVKNLLLLILLLMAYVPIADAKCAKVEYELSGIVTDTTGQQVKDARIKIEWVEVKEFKVTATGTSDRSGKFIVKFMYYPWSKTILGGRDVCDSQLTEVNLAVSAKGHESFNSLIKLNGKQSSINIKLHRSREKSTE